MSSGRVKNPERDRDDGNGPRQDQNRAGSDDEIDITASVGGHHESERHEDAADGDQEDVHAFVQCAMRNKQNAFVSKRQAQRCKISSPARFDRVAQSPRRLRRATFVLGERMASRRPTDTRKPLLTLHDWEAKHYVIAAVVILVVMGMFAYSWS
jgi:hypothetical protein